MLLIEGNKALRDMIAPLSIFDIEKSALVFNFSVRLQNEVLVLTPAPKGAGQAVLPMTDSSIRFNKGPLHRWLTSVGSYQVLYAHRTMDIVVDLNPVSPSWKRIPIMKVRECPPKKRK